MLEMFVLIMFAIGITLLLVFWGWFAVLYIIYFIAIIIASIILGLIIFGSFVFDKCMNVVRRFK